MSQINKEGNYTLTSFDKVRIVMVNTTEPGNIGAAARAMKNMMLSELYLVAPSNFPSAVATARASGADDVLSSATVCSSLEEALVGVNLVIGASARQRNIKWRQLDVIETCNEIQSSVVSNNQEVAVVFETSLPSNHILYELNLEDSGILPPDMVSITQGLKINDSL